MPGQDPRCPSCGAAVDGGPAALASHCAYCRTPSPRPPAQALPAARPFEDFVHGIAGFSAGSGSVTVTRVDQSAGATYEVNGRVYKSLDEVPAEMREMLAQAEASLAAAQGGAPTALPMQFLREVQVTSLPPDAHADAALARHASNPNLVLHPVPVKDPARDARLVLVTIVVTVLAILAVMAVVAIVK